MTNGRIKTSLLSLPDELLSAIFCEVMYTHGARTTAALVSTCRRLAPIVRQEVYRELWVGNNEAQVDVLSELFAKRPDIKALVRGLHVERTAEEDDDGRTILDYTPEHPCIKLLRSAFPALHTLTVLEATPVEISMILDRVAATTCPEIRRLMLQCAPGSGDPTFGKHKTIWWHFLAGLPELESLTITTTPTPRNEMIVFEDENGRPVSPLRGLQSLTLGEGMPCTVGAPSLATLFPDLKSLQLTRADSDALDHFLRTAPTSLTQLTFWVLSLRCPTLQDDSLARFPRLERLCLHGVDAAVLLPSIRMSRIKYLRISVDSAFTDDMMLELVEGPVRMKNLKELQLDYVSSRHGPHSWTRHELALALRRDTQYDLAQIKAALSPGWPQGCSAEGLCAVMDAARKNGIKVYGTAIDGLNWSDRFDEQIERHLVDDALASNDYTEIENCLGEDGAAKAISRQRPRLAELIRKGLA